MKLVRFKDGMYGIRKGFWPFYRYKDLLTVRRWLSQGSSSFIDCRGPKEYIMDLFNKLIDKGEIIS